MQQFRAMRLLDVRSETFFGQCIILAGDTPETRLTILEQMIDNYSMVVSVIGFYNATLIMGGIIGDVNNYVRRKYTPETKKAEI